MFLSHFTKEGPLSSRWLFYRIKLIFLCAAENMVKSWSHRQRRLYRYSDSVWATGCLEEIIGNTHLGTFPWVITSLTCGASSTCDPGSWDVVMNDTWVLSSGSSQQMGTERATCVFHTESECSERETLSGAVWAQRRELRVGKHHLMRVCLTGALQDG